MTLDDARVRLTTALDDPTAARWLTPGDIAALRLVLDALPTREQLKALEWSADALCEGDEICPVCHQNRHERVHVDDCWLARLLG